MADEPAPVPVTVYSRENCHLCAEAIETLERAADTADVPIALEEVDVDEEPNLRVKYGERVPYILVDGRPAFKYRVDPDEARRRLQTALDA